MTLEALKEGLSKGLAIVTGGAGRVGSVFVSSLLRSNYEILILSRSEESFQNLLKTTPEEYHSKLKWIAMDLRSKSSINYAVQTILERHKYCNILVNCASDSGRGKFIKYSAESMEGEFWGAIIGAMYFTESILPIIREASEGDKKIINVSSLWGSLAPDFKTYLDMDIGPSPVLVAAKSALNGYTKYLASREADFGITCNALAPGFFPRSGKNDRPDYIAKISERTMVPRIGKLQDLMPAVDYLLSDALYTTGTVLTVDGGYSSW